MRVNLVLIAGILLLAGIEAVSAGPDDLIASFTVNATTGITPAAFLFTNTSTGSPTTWNWSFQGYGTNTSSGIFSTDENPVKTFETGNFLISLNVTNTTAYNVSTQTTFVNISGATTTDVSQIMYATPHPVKFIVRTLLGYPVMNATVNATYMETSGLLDWLLSWFGVPTNVDVQNTTMSGHTGLDGAIVFSMVPVVKYDVEVTSDSGNASLHQFYPKDDEYTIWLGGNLTGNLSGGSFFEHGHDLIHDVGFVVNGTETSSTTGDLGVAYTDLLNSTVQCYVTVNQSHSYGNYTNETTVDVYGYTPAGTSNFSHIFTINNQRDQSYLVHLMCNHTIFGNFTRDAGVTYPPGPISFGIPEELLPYVGMGALFFIALCFTRTLPGPASIAVMFFAWIFYLLRWWRDFAPEIILVPGLIAFSVLAVMFNVMLRSKKIVFE